MSPEDRGVGSADVADEDWICEVDVRGVLFDDRRVDEFVQGDMEGRRDGHCKGLFRYNEN